MHFPRAPHTSDCSFSVVILIAFEFRTGTEALWFSWHYIHGTRLRLYRAILVLIERGINHLTVDFFMCYVADQQTDNLMVSHSRR